MSTAAPRWATPERLALLAKIAAFYVGKTGWQVDILSGKVTHPEYQAVVEGEDFVVESSSYYYKIDQTHPIVEDGRVVGCPIVKAPVTVMRKWHRNGLIDDWVAEDREQRAVERLEEQKRLHATSDRNVPMRGRFSAVSRDVYHDAQPLYYIEAIGLSAVTLRPFAKVRIPSSYTYVYVDIGACFRPLSRNKRKKLVKYARGIPVDVEHAISATVLMAIRRIRR
ncbi:MAG: hypothetical protein HYX90_03225 [Chloroflexi bacterium]|nr:hypothetical protein [Chloroflexota bacterium]